MSNGYGQKPAVRPASTGGWGDYGYHHYASTAQTLPATSIPSMNAPLMQAHANMPLTMGATMMPAQANMPLTMGASMMPAQANMPLTMGASMMPAQAAMPMMKGAPTVPPSVPSGAVVTPSGGNVVQPIAEESFVENILRLNRGKMATFYMTYENNREWNAKIFRGIIEAAGRDHIIISDPSTGMRYLLLTLNLDYVTFDGPIAYQYPFQGGSVTNATPMPAQTTGR